jgi:hypothetical protein
VLPYINQKPTIDSIPDQNVKMGSGEQTITITGISDGNIGTQNITLSEAKSSNNLVKNTKITYNQGDHTATYIYTPRTTGTLTVTLTLTDDGGNLLGGTNEISTSFNINISAATSSTNLSSNELVIYPNPANNLINISIPNNISGNAKVEICNVTGAAILQQKVFVTDGIIIIPTDKLLNRIYIVKLTSEGRTLIAKVLIKK